MITQQTADTLHEALITEWGSGEFYYVASPYTNYPDGHSAAALAVASVTAQLTAAGVPVFSPIAHGQMLLDAAPHILDATDHEFWMRADQPMMNAAGGLIVVMLEGWRQSRGVRQEIMEFVGRPIFLLDPSTMEVRPMGPGLAALGVPKLIALSGLMGSGKSTVADFLSTSFGFRVHKFAGPMKEMMYSFGLTHEEVEGSLKDEPCAKLCGQTPRHAMQTLGTQWGRDQIGPNVWVQRAARRIERDLGNGGLVVVDDLRFPNEAEAIRNLGGVVWRIERPGIAATGHESERMEFDADCTILNSGSMEALHSIIERKLLP